MNSPWSRLVELVVPISAVLFAAAALVCVIRIGSIDVDCKGVSSSWSGPGRDSGSLEPAASQPPTQGRGSSRTPSEGRKLASGAPAVGICRHLPLGLSDCSYLIKTRSNFMLEDIAIRSAPGTAIKVYTGREGFSVGLPSKGNEQPVPRGTIGEFSGASTKRLIRYLVNSAADYSYFGTLTLADDILSSSQFRAARDRFLTWFMRAQRRIAHHEQKGQQSICWFLEFQQRGAPHLHFYYTTPVPWKEAASIWCDAIDQPWAFNTSTKFEKLRDKNLSSYAAKVKYAAKADQKKLPDGQLGYGRFWGVRGADEVLSATSLVEVSNHSRDQVIAALELIDKRVSIAQEQAVATSWSWEHGVGRTVRWADAATANRVRSSVESAVARLLIYGVRQVPDPGELGG